ncbi:MULTISPECIES: hypothetical protein [Acidianus]|uniref:Uncharacterized protein n=1 Tax=Candidatus Acidianus copahuensis TaxID=1160895 RepID=A0A031LM78_9CREN|nr:MULTISPECIES: hypothetical protein [Acidianus]EZQ06753.1 hypothetical protein CM19_05000 [Candidatus Acidianus copahuensis]NON63263.1 hypothetical protein [Acidianus sp. RZ1]
MVKLINCQNVPPHEKRKALRILNDETDVYLFLSKGKIIEYIKSYDIDSGEILLIRQKSRLPLAKEIRRLVQEKFTVKVFISSEDLS